MADKQLFKIGEVARMYHLSLGILRHYEKEGLLAPEYTDPETGYRYTAHASLRCSTRSVICGCWTCRLRILKNTCRTGKFR